MWENGRNELVPSAHAVARRRRARRATDAARQNVAERPSVLRVERRVDLKNLYKSDNVRSQLDS